MERLAQREMLRLFSPAGLRSNPLFLLAQRLTREPYPESRLMAVAERIADFLREGNRADTVANLQVVLLNTRRRMIGVQNAAQGTLDTQLMHLIRGFSDGLRDYRVRFWRFRLLISE